MTTRTRAAEQLTGASPPRLGPRPLGKPLIRRVLAGSLASASSRHALSAFICTLFVILKVLDATAGPQVTG